jgi:hypothetical protein
MANTENIKKFPPLIISVNESGFEIQSGSLNGTLKFEQSLARAGIYKCKEVDSVLSDENFYNLKEAIAGTVEQKNALAGNIIALTAMWIKIEKNILRSKYFLIGLFFPVFKPRLEKCKNDLVFTRNAYAGCHLDIEFRLDVTVRGRYDKLRQAFTRAGNCNKIWINGASKAIGEAQQYADFYVERNETFFLYGDSAVFSNRADAMIMLNRDKQWYYLFYPAFLLLYIKPKKAYYLIDYKDVNIEHERNNFIEDENADVPSDARDNIFDYTYKYVKGHDPHRPDLRFNDNPEMPRVHYYQLRIKSPEGIDENFIFSNMEAGNDFARALSRYVDIFRGE